MKNMKLQTNTKTSSEMSRFAATQDLRRRHLYINEV